MRVLDVVFWTFFGGGVLFIIGIWIKMGVEAWRERRRPFVARGRAFGTGGISGLHSHDTSVSLGEYSTSSDLSTDTSGGEAGDSGGGGDFSGGGGESGGGGSSGSWS